MHASSPYFGRRPPSPSPQNPGVRLGRGAFVSLIAFALLAALWAVGATGFIVFRDDLSARLIARQVENQYAYEERVAALRAHVDRLASRQMLDQDGVEARVADLMSRQAQLETRSALVAMLAQGMGAEAGSSQTRKTMPEGSAPLPAPTPPQPSPPPSVTSFAPLAPKPLPVFEPLRGSEPSAAGRPVDDKETVRRRVSSLGQSLSVMERQQLSALGRIEAQSRAKVQRLRGVMTEAGVDPDRVAPLTTASGKPANPIGGPLVPLAAEEPQNFEVALNRAKALMAAAHILTKASKLLPIRHPLGRDADVTSTFGVRNDPFTRGYAMHTGVDFRADHGTPARATGGGVVIKAEYSGGYGNLVEVDHGNGLTTRYAHLSSIAVEEGQRVEPGAIVGRVGSTGRSTGPHLHYETRVSGDATDPTRFLKIGGRNRDLF